MALLPPPPANYKGRFAIAALLLLFFGATAVYGDHGLMHLLRMRGEQRELERMAFEQQQRNQQLRERVQRLESDDRYIEKQARERYGMVKKGELTYRLLPPAPPAAR